MKSLASFIIESQDDHNFDKEANITINQFNKLRKDLKNDNYLAFYNEDDRLYTIHKKPEGDSLGDYVGLFICRQGTFYWDSKSVIAKYIDKYIK